MIFIDPSGLVTVAFYDSQLNYKKVNGKYQIWLGVFEEYANDHIEDPENYMFEMRSPRDALLELAKLKEAKVNVTEVYFYDHSWAEDASSWSDDRRSGLEFGTEMKWQGAEGGPGEIHENDVEDFCKALQVMTTNATFHFRQCFTGSNPESLKDLARWTQSTVTGVDGMIIGSGALVRPDLDTEKNIGESLKFWENLTINPINPWIDYFLVATGWHPLTRLQGRLEK